MDTKDNIIKFPAKETQINVGRVLFNTQLLTKLLGLPEDSIIRNINLNSMGKLGMIEFTVESSDFSPVSLGALIPQYRGITTIDTLGGGYIESTTEWNKC